MRKIIIFYTMALILLSCQNNRLNHLEKNIVNFLVSSKGNSELILDTISNVTWDEIIIAGPYTNLEKISNYNFNAFPNTIKSHDSFILFGFINEKKGIKYFEISRNLVSDNIFENNNLEYKIYSKSESNLLILK